MIIAIIIAAIDFLMGFAQITARAVVIRNIYTGSRVPNDLIGKGNPFCSFLFISTNASTLGRHLKNYDRSIEASLRLRKRTNTTNSLNFQNTWTLVNSLKMCRIDHRCMRVHSALSVLLPPLVRTLLDLVVLLWRWRSEEPPASGNLPAWNWDRPSLCLAGRSRKRLGVRTAGYWYRHPSALGLVRWMDGTAGQRFGVSSVGCWTGFPYHSEKNGRESTSKRLMFTQWRCKSKWHTRPNGAACVRTAG